MPLFDASTNYYKVTFELNGQEFSTPEVEITELAFAGIVAEARGNFSGGNGSPYLIGVGGYVIFKLLPPYDTNVIWYKDGMPLMGCDKNQLKVNSAGVYNVEAAPADCPDFMNQLAADLVVREK